MKSLSQAYESEVLFDVNFELIVRLIEVLINWCCCQSVVCCLLVQLLLYDKVRYETLF